MLDSIYKKAINLLEEYRGIVIVVFCLPASIIFNLVQRIIALGSKFIDRSPHDQRVRRIQTQVREWAKQPANQRKPLCSRRPTWQSLSTSFFDKNSCEQIDVNLTEVLGLDEKRMIVRVEPMVTVRDIIRYLRPRGYALAVTLEIADATLGGLALAVGMTTHSHKVGLYQETVESYEVVLSDGSLVKTSQKNQFKDLHHCLPWSHGSLGLLVALDLQIVKAKQYVKIEYLPVKTGVKDYCQKIRELSGALDRNAETPDFLEATVFSRDEAVIMIGNYFEPQSFADFKKINRVSLWYKPWFYKHVQSFLDSGPGEDILPLEDYLLRHNRAIFWVLESLIPFGNNPIFRFFLGWACPPKPAFLKFTTTQGVRELTLTKQVFQDIVLPMTVLEDSIDKAVGLFDTMPLLIYPCRIYNRDGQGQLRSPKPDQFVPGTDYGMFYDLGVYGIPGQVKRKEYYDASYAMRSMEKFIIDAGGYSFLYADIFLTWAEFQEMFDLTAYEKVRKRYGFNGAFPNLYDKVKPEVDVIEVSKKRANVY